MKRRFVLIISLISILLTISGCASTDSVKTDLDVALTNGKVTQEGSNFYLIDSFSFQGMNYSSRYNKDSKMFDVSYVSSDENISMKLTLRKGNYFSFEQKMNSNNFEVAYTNKNGDVKCILKDKTLCGDSLLVQVENSIEYLHESLESSLFGITNKKLSEYGYNLVFSNN